MLLLVRFKDKKHVYLLRSKRTARFYEKSRYLSGGKKATFNKTAHIDFYKKNMGSVAAVNQDIEPYNSFRQKTHSLRK